MQQAGIQSEYCVTSRRSRVKVLKYAVTRFPVLLSRRRFVKRGEAPSSPADPSNHRELLLVAGQELLGRFRAGLGGRGVPV
jgi:hypothetical protein